MTNLLKTAAIAALITGFANSAWATPHGGSAELRQAELQTASYTETETCLLYTSPSPRDRTRYRMPSSA